MAHKEASARQFRLWLRPETMKQVRILALLLNRDDPNQVADDMMRLGVAYTNHVAKLDMADYDGRLELMDLDDDLQLRVLRGALPKPGELR